MDPRWPELEYGLGGIVERGVGFAAGLGADAEDELEYQLSRLDTILTSARRNGVRRSRRPAPRPGIDLGDSAERFIDASTGPSLLSAAQVARAVQANRRYASSLWRGLYSPIAIYYLRYRTMTPTEEEFAQAVARWQQAVGMRSADGVLGPQTWRPMRPRGEPVTYTTPGGLARPRGLAQVIAAFSDPRNNHAAWERANIVRASAPSGYQFRLLTGGTSQTVRVHRLLRTHFEDLFRALAGAGLWGAIQPVSGPYAYRNIAGSTSISMHAFGIAIDINPSLFARGQTRSIPDPYVIQVFQDHGFHWGMFFPTPDAMHFQFATMA